MYFTKLRRFKVKESQLWDLLAFCNEQFLIFVSYQNRTNKIETKYGILWLTLLLLKLFGVDFCRHGYGSSIIENDDKKLASNFQNIC